MREQLNLHLEQQEKWLSSEHYFPPTNSLTDSFNASLDENE
jgi:hypothetical protein